MSYIEALNWRYATKKMNGTEVPHEKVEKIVESIRLAPSAYGLQPFNVLLIKDIETRKKLLPAINNQPQITTGSALLVFAIIDDINEDTVDTYMENVALTRGIDLNDLKGFKNMIMGYLNGKSKETLQVWAAKQAYLALGVGITTAALEGVDATPMEGFNPAALDEVLDLSKLGLKSIVLLMLGYRDEATDPIIKLKKVRKRKEDFVVEK